jgi:hypothetical protein
LGGAHRSLATLLLNQPGLQCWLEARPASAPPLTVLFASVVHRTTSAVALSVVFSRRAAVVSRDAVSAAVPRA